MSLIASAISSINKANNEALVATLNELSKEEIQEVAKHCQVQSATFRMGGTWVEESTADLIRSDGELIQSNVHIERGFKGILTQYFGSDSLHFAAVVALYNSDFDEDYFSPGEMLFGEDYGYPATSVQIDADCKFEERHIRHDEIEDENLEIDECELSDVESDFKLGSTYILSQKVELLLSNNKKLVLPLLDGGANVKWFVFSALFISSKKTLNDIRDHEWAISEFMKDQFDIDVSN